MSKFRKKPVVIEAIQWTGLNVKELESFTQNEFYQSEVDFGTSFGSIKTLEGKHTVTQFDWVIKGVKGEHYACKPDIFEQTYEAVDD